MRDEPRACVARVTAMPFEVLERLAAHETVTRLAPWLAAEGEIGAECEALGAELFRIAGAAADASPGHARRRTALLAARRDLHHRRPPRPARDPAALEALPPSLAAGLARVSERLERHEREAEAIAAAFRSDVERAERELVRVMTAPPAAEGLRLVARALLARLRRAAAIEPGAWRHEQRHVAAKAAAYLGRFATKTSPNGVFCATARVEFRRAGPEVRGENRAARIEVRLNVGEARKVTACLAADETLEPIVVPRPNPTLRRTAAGWTFWKPASPRHADDSEVRSEVPAHPVLGAFLEEAGRGTLTVPELIAAAAGRCGLDPGAADVRGFYRKLVDRGLLVAELEVPWSSWRPLADLARAARRGAAAPAWLAEAEAIEQAADGLESLASEARPAAMDALEARLERLPHRRPLVADDLFRADAATALEIALPEAMLEELAGFTSLYARFYSAMYPAVLYRAGMVRRFLERYPADTDVELLDLYHGVFEPTVAPRPAAFPEPHGDERRAPEWSEAGAAFRRFRDHFAARARDAAGLAEITIGPAEWERLLGERPVPAYSCGVLFQVAAGDLDALAAGRWRACLNAIYPGGGLSVSRLASLHRAPDGGGWIEDELRRGYRWLGRDGAVLAEVGFMHGGRTANAGLRPPLLACEIELPGDRATPGATALPLADLTVRFDRASGEFHLRSRSRGVRIVPIVSSGISSEGFIAFLVEIGRQATQPLAHFPGFEAEGVSVWPRVRCGNVVLFRRRWKFGAGEVPGAGARRIDVSTFVAVARWRGRYELPRHVFVHSSADPKPFYVDLESPLFVEQMLRSVPPAAGPRQGDGPAEAPAAFHVTEMLPGPDELWVRDPDGRYASEFLVHLTHPEAGFAAGSPAEAISRAGVPAPAGAAPKAGR